MNMSEFWSSFSKWFSEKASSPLYWTYFGFFIVWNWKFFQIIFLEDSGLFKAPRVEYLNTLLFSPFNISAVDGLINILWHTLPPVLFTYIAIVYLPRLHKWALGIHLVHHFERKAMFQEHKAEHEKNMAKLTRQEAVAKKERVVQEKIIERTKTQEEKWQEDFEQIKRPDLLNGFQSLVGAIYRQGGVLYAHQVEGSLSNSSAIMAFAGTNDLIDTEKRESGSPLIKLTDKGKYFSRLLSDKGIIVH